MAHGPRDVVLALLSPMRKTTHPNSSGVRHQEECFYRTRSLLFMGLSQSLLTRRVFITQEQYNGNACGHFPETMPTGEET